MKAPAEVEQFLTTSQAAKISHVTRFTVANLVKNGKLSAVYTAGGHRRIPRKDLEEFVKMYCKPRPAGVGSSAGRFVAGMIKRGLFDTGKFIGKMQRGVGGGIRYLSNEKK